MNDTAKPITKTLAQGFTDGGMDMVFNYPGFFSHEIFRLLNGKEIQLSEKHAYAEAFGSSLAGKRTLVTFKNVGLNVASDVFLHSQISGVGAGLVLLIFDDIDVWGSQESQDSRHFMDLYGGLLLEPSDLQEAYVMAHRSFLLSEKYQTPVIIRITNEHLRLPATSIKRITEPTERLDFENRKENLIVHPFYWTKQYASLREKITKLAKTKDLLPNLPVPSSDTLVVSFGGAASLLPKLDQTHNYDSVQVSSLPLHESLLKLVGSKRYSKIIVAEYGQPYVYEKIAAVSLVPVESITPDILSSAKIFTEWTRDEKLFEAIERVKQAMDKLFVFSDITRSTVESRHVVDASLSYGSALSAGIGYSKSMPENHAVISVVGDGSINHEGLNTITYAAQHDIDLTLVIVDNGGLWCTGGQSAATDIEKFLVKSGQAHSKIDIDNDSVTDIESLIQGAVEKEGFSVILAKAQMGSFRGE